MYWYKYKIAFLYEILYYSELQKQHWQLMRYTVLTPIKIKIMVF